LLILYFQDSHVADDIVIVMSVICQIVILKASIPVEDCVTNLL